MSIVLDSDVETSANLVDGNRFPNILYVLRNSLDKYSAFCFGPEQIHGIACFETLEKADKARQTVYSWAGADVVEVTFDEAVEVVVMRRRHHPELKCLFLMDDSFECPKATYWIPPV